MLSWIKFGIGRERGYLRRKINERQTPAVTSQDMENGFVSRVNGHSSCLMSGETECDRGPELKHTFHLSRSLKLESLGIKEPPDSCGT